MATRTKGNMSLELSETYELGYFQLMLRNFIVTQRHAFMRLFGRAQAIC